MDQMREGSVVIDCDECLLDGTDACDDCVVSVLLRQGAASGLETRPQQGAVIVDVLEARAMRMLQAEGLLPGLRFTRRVS